MIEQQRELIPVHLRPAACQQAGCTFQFLGPGVTLDDAGGVVFNAFDEGGGVFTHESGGKTDRFFIPTAWVMDMDHDLWAEIKPWLERLHEEPTVVGGD